VIFKDLGVELESIQLSDLGKVKKVKITSDATVFVGGGGKKDAIAGRVDQIRREIEGTDSEYDKEKLQERLAKLAGGVAQINVGATTETEMKERKDLLDDAKAATAAALAEGIVPGGGVALLRCEKALKKVADLVGDEEAGARIIQQVLEYPLRSIAENAGFDGGVVVNRVRGMKGTEGFNADKGEYVDMLAAGVIDPAKVVKTALTNAASVASLLLTTESLITEIPSKEEAGGDHHDHGMGGDMGMGGMGGMPTKPSP